MGAIQNKVCSNLVKATFLAATIIFFSFSAKATHLMGGEISYTNVGTNQYKITLKLYRDCAGVNLSNTVTVNVTGGSSGSISLSRTSMRDVSILCPGQVSRCNGPVSGAAPGIQEWVYENTVTFLPAAP